MTVEELQILDKKKMPNHPQTPQLLKKAEELAKFVENRRNLYEDSETWSSQQELIKIFKKIIVKDLEYALEKKAEQMMWNSCFKNFINHLQTKTREKDAKIKAAAQISLSAVLENASGFYILLLEEIRFTFKLTVPFLQNGNPYGTLHYNQAEPVESLPSKAATNYICQHCLVHLGDIARYRNNLQQAETFYRHATTMAPSSGQPYNQIAILEASRSNKLSTVYFYVRAVCLAYPFPAAFTNLSKLFSKLANIAENGEARDMKERTGKINQHTFVPLFLRIQGLLHHSSNLAHCVSSTRALCESMTSLVATESLSTWQLLQILAINIWLWEHTSGGNTGGDGGGACLSKEEQICLAVVADMQAALLSAILLPIYTVKKGKSLLSYHALPAVRILLEWISSVPEIITYPGWISRQLIWPGCAHLLNEIENLLTTDESEFENSGVFPLPEEYDLQAFKPLVTSFSKYNYKLVADQQNCPTSNQLALIRITRIRDSCKRFTEAPFRLLEKSGEGEWKAVPQSADHQKPVLDVEQILQDLQKEKGVDMFDEDDTDEEESIEWENEPESLGKGILKTKSKPSQPAQPTGPRYRATRQNVAMAAILNETADTQEDNEEDKSESKRVMFLTPTARDENDEKTKEPKVVDLAPVKGQGSTTKKKEQTASVQLKSNESRTNPSNQDLSKKSTNQMNVKDLDLSRPPPSLHSNVRPPKLINSPSHEPQDKLSQPPVSASIYEQTKINNSGSRMNILPGISPLSLAESSFPKPVQNQMQALSIQERRFEEQYPTLASPAHANLTQHIAAFNNQSINNQLAGSSSPLANFGANYPQAQFPQQQGSLIPSGFNSNITSPSMYYNQLQDGNSGLAFQPNIPSPSPFHQQQHEGMPLGGFQPGGLPVAGIQQQMINPEERQQQQRPPAADSGESTNHKLPVYSLFSGGSPWRGGLISSADSTPDSSKKGQ